MAVAYKPLRVIQQKGMVEELPEALKGGNLRSSLAGENSYYSLLKENISYKGWGFENLSTPTDLNACKFRRRNLLYPSPCGLHSL